MLAKKAITVLNVGISLLRTVKINDTTLNKVCTYVFTVAKVSVCERCAVRLDMYLRKKGVNVIGRNCLSNL